MSVRIAVFASGGGTNLQALLDHFSHDDAASVELVISDRADAGALQRARAGGAGGVHVPVRGRDPDAVAADTIAALDAHRIDLVALAGYLQLVPAAVTDRYAHRIVNIHPALLPAFGGRGMYGRHVHAAVLAAGCRVTGVTVHRVDANYDEGGIIAQWPVPVLAGDTAESLAARVLRVEHRLYPVVLSVLARSIAAAPADATAHAVADAPGDVYRLAPSLAGAEREISSSIRL